MHTTREIDGVYFHHNGDYSGDVIVNIPFKQADLEISTTTARARIPFRALEALVANKYRSDMISKAEQADDDAILEASFARQATKQQEDPSLVDWLISLADPRNYKERRNVTLNDIIDRAAEVKVNGA